MTARSRIRGAVGIAAFALAIAPPALAAPRSDRPWTVSGTIGVPGGLGVDAQRMLTDRFAVSAQVATWVAISDAGLRARGYVVGSDHVALVLSGGAHALVAPILFTPGALAFEGTVGGEYRADAGFTLALDAGPAAWLSLPHHTEGGGGVNLAAFVQLRAGWSF